jgi:hypothetical protein
LVDKEGNVIDYNQPITLFNGVTLVSRYLETRLNLNPDLISDEKLTEILALFKDNKSITVIELFDHIHQLYKKDPSIFHLLKVNASEISSPTKEHVETIMVNKPLGELGDITFNQAYTYLEKLEWKKVINNVELSINVLPAAAHLIGYKIIVGQYIKYYHKRPYTPNLSPERLKNEMRNRNRLLLAFLFMGAPAILYGVNFTAKSLKDLITINVPLSSSTEPPVSDNNSGVLSI